MVLWYVCGYLVGRVDEYTAVSLLALDHGRLVDVDRHLVHVIRDAVGEHHLAMTGGGGGGNQADGVMRRGGMAVIRRARKEVRCRWSQLQEDKLVMKTPGASATGDN